MARRLFEELSVLLILPGVVTVYGLITWAVDKLRRGVFS